MPKGWPQSVLSGKRTAVLASESKLRHLEANAQVADGLHNSASEHAVLVEAAEKASPSEPQGEDVVRDFFRRRVGRISNATTSQTLSLTKAKQGDELSKLLEEYLPLLQQQGVSTALPLNERTAILYQVDRDLTLSYKATIRHRIEHGSLYGIPLGPDSQTCLSEPWSSRPKLLELMRLAFDTTDKLLLERSRVIGSNIDDDKGLDYGSTNKVTSGRFGASVEDERETQRILKAHLVELADYTLAMHQERMSYLQKCVPQPLQFFAILTEHRIRSLGDDSQAISELRDLLEIYVVLRPRVIDTMGQ